MRSLSQLSIEQFKRICNEIGIEKVKTFAKGSNLFGENALLSKKHKKRGFSILLKLHD